MKVFGTLLLIIGLGIALAVGAFTYRAHVAKHHYVADLEQLLRDANRVSVATQRGVTKQEFIDAYENVKYNWEHKKYEGGSANPDFTAVQSDIDKAIAAWEAARTLWEMKEVYRDNPTLDAGSVNSLRSLGGKAIVDLRDALGGDMYDELDRAAKSKGSFLYHPDNISSLISLCFSTASSALSDAERRMDKFRP